MSDWKEFSIGEIADPKDRYSFSGGPFGSNLKSEEYTESGVRIIQLQNIGDGHFKDDYKIYTSEEKADELLSCNIYPGEIILSKMGDPVARATHIPDSEERYLMASDGIRLKVDPTRFDSTFILNAINSPQFRSRAEAVSVGSTRKRIGLTTLKGLTIYAPPLPEQKKIAEILSGIDKRTNTLKKQRQKLENIYKACSGELFSAVRNRVPLGNACDLQVGFPFRSADFREVGTRLLRGENVGYGKPEWSRAQFLPLSLSEESSQYNLEAGDIVIGMDRSFTKSGFKVSRISPSDLPCLLVQRVGRFVPKGITRNYLWHILQSVEYQKTVSASEKGMDIPHLSKSEILEPMVPLADDEHQEQISNTLDSLMNSLSAINCSIRTTTQLAIALRSDLLSGRKRVSV
jgi:type I restriction enzyme S subunit